MRLAPLMLALGLGLAACAPTPQAPTSPNAATGVYGARTDSGPNGEPIEINAVRPAYLNDRNRRQQVAYNGTEAAGTLGLPAKYFEPSRPFSSPVTSTNSTERFGRALAAAMSRAISSTEATPAALSSAPA